MSSLALLAQLTLVLRQPARCHPRPGFPLHYCVPLSCSTQLQALSAAPGPQCTSPMWWWGHPQGRDPGPRAGALPMMASRACSGVCRDLPEMCSALSVQEER